VSFTLDCYGISFPTLIPSFGIALMLSSSRAGARARPRSFRFALCECGIAEGWRLFPIPYEKRKSPLIGALRVGVTGFEPVASAV
jgi:hypothetical protein